MNRIALRQYTTGEITAMVILHGITCAVIVSWAVAAIVNVSADVGIPLIMIGILAISISIPFGLLVSAQPRQDYNEARRKAEYERRRKEIVDSGADDVIIMAHLTQLSADFGGGDGGGGDGGGGD